MRSKRSPNRWLARSTVFAVFFAATAFVLAWLGRLTGDYVGMCTAVQALVVGRALGDDYHERCKWQQAQPVTVPDEGVRN